MKKFFKKIFTSPCIIALILIVALFTTASAFGVGNRAIPSTYYQTGELSDKSYYDAVCYKVDLSDAQKISSLWINFGSLDGDGERKENVTFHVRAASSETGSMQPVATDISLNNTYEKLLPGKWQQLVTNFLSFNTYPYVLILTKDTVKINELAFVGVDKENKTVLLKAEAEGAGGKKVNGTVSLSGSPEFDRSEGAKAKAKILTDEQSRFDVNKIESGIYKEDGLNKTEYSALESARNITTGRGYYIDNSSAPLGFYFLSLGTTVFGGNTLGLRIVPLLFAIGLIILAYFIGKTLFNSEKAGALNAFLIAAGGFALSFATLGASDIISAFFVMLGFYSAIKFYKKGISKLKPTKSYLNLMLCALSLGVAIAVKPQALYASIAVVIVYIIGVIRQYRAYTYKKAVLSDDDKEALLEVKSDYRRKLLYTLVVGVGSIIILPLIISLVCYLIAYKSFSSFYQSTNFVKYAIKNFGGILTSKNPVNVWGYAVNYEAQSITENKLIFGNLIIVFVNLFAFLYGLCNVVMVLIDSRKTGINKSDKFGFVMPFVFFLIGYLISFLLLFIGGTQGIGGYLIPSLFATGMTVSVYNYTDIQESKTLFSVGKLNVKVLTIITLILVLGMAITAGLAVSGLIGGTADSSLYMWNILKR